jgi:hypothetical protein
LVSIQEPANAQWGHLVIEQKQLRERNKKKIAKVIPCYIGCTTMAHMPKTCTRETPLNYYEGK